MTIPEIVLAALKKRSTTDDRYSSFAVSNNLPTIPPLLGERAGVRASVKLFFFVRFANRPFVLATLLAYKPWPSATQNRKFHPGRNSGPPFGKILLLTRCAVAKTPAH